MISNACAPSRLAASEYTDSSPLYSRQFETMSWTSPSSDSQLPYAPRRCLRRIVAKSIGAATTAE